MKLASPFSINVEKPFIFYYGPRIHDSFVNPTGNIVSFQEALIHYSDINNSVYYNGINARFPDKRQLTQQMIDTLDFVTGVPYQVAPQYTQMHIIDELNVRHGLGSSIIIDSPDTVFDVLPTHDARTRLTAHLQNWANIRGNPIYFILNADNFGRLEDIASSNNQLPNIIRNALPYGNLKEEASWASLKYIPEPDQEELLLLLQVYCSTNSIYLEESDSFTLARNMAREKQLLNYWIEKLEMINPDETLDFNYARQHEWFTRSVDYRKTAIERASEMIGIEDKLKVILKIAKERKNAIARGDKKIPPLSFLFLGPPGTGKTELGYVWGDLCFESELLKYGQLIYTTATDLQAGYVAQTPLKTKARLDLSRDNVFFYDEAYTMSQGFGEEVFATIVAHMTKKENKGKIAYVLAGYEDSMRKALSINPGGDSRFLDILYFKPQDDNTLINIWMKMAFDSGLRFTQDVPSMLSDLIPKMRHESEKQNRNWGNAREMETLLTMMKRERAYRCEEQQQPIDAPFIPEDLPEELMHLLER